ncbi:hypothetical protein [Bifidobacterium simiarum]|uniref:Uncharacterized protein n=1 Tax=Bifidobacterium simiarum TaxID=2045441 RepID=A0A2M9HC62_9BIFI|nr:hypothetical protein [Bifidobacterium simiarum]PJM74382.1 hypothetical protein CSQ87_10580 [Bifidobacterium simiarum]
MCDKWVAGFYWWDLSVAKQGKYVLSDQNVPGHDDGKESWPAGQARSMTASVTSQAVNGLVGNWDQKDVDANTKFDGHSVIGKGDATRLNEFSFVPPIQCRSSSFNLRLTVCFVDD